MARWKAAKAARSWLAGAWPLMQATAAAVVAWLIAVRIDHEDPFFAPIAAMVALNFASGERGRSAVRLLIGVGIGIVTGELTVLVLGGAWGSLALATFVALVVAQSVTADRLVRVQAAAAAILTVAVSNGGASGDRLLDALIGAGVALVFTQVLFSPEPLALVRRAEKAALEGIAEGLELAADTIEHGADAEELPAQLINRMQDVRE